MPPYASAASNMLMSLQHIIRYSNTALVNPSNPYNRANSMGGALEAYILDSFANSFHSQGQERLERLSQIFSYQGNQNNPPDMIVKHGDAIEVKKIQSPYATIALNSSYPKDVLHRDDPRLTHTCRSLLDWHEESRDLLYIIGFAEHNYLNHLFYVYGDCYAASRQTYQRIQQTITSGIQGLSPEVTLQATKELGRVNQVDPLGITSLRIRGMWQINNPHKVFDYLQENQNDATFSIRCIMRQEKYLSFPVTDREAITTLGVVTKPVKIKNPNNPIQLIDAICLQYEAPLPEVL